MPSMTVKFALKRRTTSFPLSVLKYNVVYLRARIHKMLVRKAYREDSDQTAP